jgi:hypothetical protein
VNDPKNSPACGEIVVMIVPQASGTIIIPPGMSSIVRLILIPIAPGAYPFLQSNAVAIVYRAVPSRRNKEMGRRPIAHEPSGAEGGKQKVTPFHLTPTE